jgi:NTE family protein
MGAMVGALHALGLRPDEMIDVFAGVDWPRLGRILVGSVVGDTFGELLDEVLGDVAIEELRLPFAAVTCDLKTGAAQVIRSGSLAAATRASAAIPGLLSPVRRGAQTLVDGAIVEPVPVAAARTLGAAPVLAVNVLSLAPAGDPTTPTAGCNRPARTPPTLRHRLERWIPRRQDSRGSGEPPGRWQAMLRSFEVMQSNLAAHTAAADQLLEPAVGHCGFFDFARVEELAEAGYRAWRRRGG